MVQVLLTNCLDLLNNEPRPDDHLEIITSSHYLLAEVYSMPNTAERCETARDPCDEEEFLWPKVGKPVCQCFEHVQQVHRAFARKGATLRNVIHFLYGNPLKIFL